MWDYSSLTAGKTAIDGQYLRDSITGSATGNSWEYAVRLRTAGFLPKAIRDTAQMIVKNFIRRRTGTITVDAVSR